MTRLNNGRDRSPNDPAGGALGERAQQPKNGLARRMRAWMAARTGTKKERRFSMQQLIDALDIPAGPHNKVTPRQRVANALYDYERRGEIESYTIRVSKWRRTELTDERQYLYIPDWHAELKGKLNRKIYKAIYVSGEFAVTDIQRLTGLKDRDWLDRIIPKLRKSGYIQPIRRRHCAHGAGVEHIYHLTDRDRFKMEFLR